MNKNSLEDFCIKKHSTQNESFENDCLSELADHSGF